MNRHSALFTATLMAAMWLGVSTASATEYEMKVLGEKHLELGGDESGRLVRFYVQLRRNSNDPMAPADIADLAPELLEHLNLEASATSDSSVSIQATVRNRDTFGSLQLGVSTLLLVDISGTMVQFWDIVYRASQEFVGQMRYRDELCIGFLGGDWVHSGWRRFNASGAALDSIRADLMKWIRDQFRQEGLDYSEDVLVCFGS